MYYLFMCIFLFFSAIYSTQSEYYTLIIDSYLYISLELISLSPDTQSSANQTQFLEQFGLWLF